MSAKKKSSTAGFDVASFISGVGRQQRVLTLCTDVDARNRFEELSAELEALANNDVDDEPLGGDPAREKILDELREFVDNQDLWTEFTVRAPSRNGKVKASITLSGVDEQGNDVVDHAARILEAEAELIQDCLMAIDGNAVSLTLEQACEMQSDWPDDLVQELVDEIRAFGSDVMSVPFSQRLSEILKTAT